jgi:hypothetical protein
MQSEAALVGAVRIQRSRLATGSSGEVERKNRTIKDKTVKRFYYESHDQLRCHLADFMVAHNFAHSLNGTCQRL